MLDFKVRILESNLGTDAITRVHIESTDGESNMGRTVGVSDNVITAKSWEALVDSVSYKLIGSPSNLTLGPTGLQILGEVER